LGALNATSGRVSFDARTTGRLLLAIRCYLAIIDIRFDGVGVWYTESDIGNPFLGENGSPIAVEAGLPFCVYENVLPAIRAGACACQGR
jgi:hypothetical protein